MMFLIDDSRLFKFGKIATNDIKNMGLVAGVSIDSKSSAEVLNYMILNYSDGKKIVKGSSVSDDVKVARFIDELNVHRGFAAFSPANWGGITEDTAQKYQRTWISEFEFYLNEAHPEYKMLTENNKNDLLKQVSKLFERAQFFSPQEFCNMLMIFEVIILLLQKLLHKNEILESQDFDGVTIMIDTQNEGVKYVIDNGLLYCFLFCSSRKTPFVSTSNKFKHKVGSKEYLDVKKLIKCIQVVSDEEHPILCVADFIANFTSKVLRGTIVSTDVIDKLSLLYKQKMHFFHFDPNADFIDVNVPDKLSYAHRSLILDVN